MKKGSARRRRIPQENSLARYDWSKARRGRYASRFPREAHAVVIDPELWPYFGTAAAINEGLRKLVKTAEFVRKPSPKMRAGKSKRTRAA